MSNLFITIPSYFEHIDDRGGIRGLINAGTWREVNLIDSNANMTRGGHFHKETKECFIILSGLIKVLFKKIDKNGNISCDERLFREGDVFIVLPYIEHTFIVLEKSQWLNLLSKPLDQSNPDFYSYAD